MNLFYTDLAADEQTTVELRTLPKPDPSVIVNVEAKRGIQLEHAMYGQKIFL